MKKSFLAIALAIATMPFVFAAQAPTDKPATPDTTATTTKKAKKHHVRKAKKTKAAKTTAKK